VMSTMNPAIKATSPLEKLAKNSMRPRVIPLARRPGTMGLLCFTTGDKGPPNTSCGAAALQIPA
jgi:hypothetical protein